MKFDRKILAVILTVGLLSILAISATLTWFSDQKTVHWTIEVKTAEIEVDPDELFFPEALAPGESTSAVITVENVGDTDFAHVTVSAGPGDVDFVFLPEVFPLLSGDIQTVDVTATLSESYITPEEPLDGIITVYATQEP